MLAQSEPSRISVPGAHLSLAASVAALLSLASLHVLSPQIDPSRRFVSEYALGYHGSVLSVMFLAWGLSTWALAFAIRTQLATIGGKIGLVFLVAAGIGEAMASVFDLKWPRLHGLSGAIGILSLPIAALLISIDLGRTTAWSSGNRLLLWTANFTWISLALMLAGMIAMSDKPAGRPFGVGWLNRILIVTYSAWAMTVAWQAVRVRRAAAISEIASRSRLPQESSGPT